LLVTKSVLNAQYRLLKLSRRVLLSSGNRIICVRCDEPGFWEATSGYLHNHRTRSGSVHRQQRAEIKGASDGNPRPPWERFVKRLLVNDLRGIGCGQLTAVRLDAFYPMCRFFRWRTPGGDCLADCESDCGAVKPSTSVFSLRLSKTGVAVRATFRTRLVNGRSRRRRWRRSFPARRFAHRGGRFLPRPDVACAACRPGLRSSR
jgi:hypothetical protein